MKLSTKSIKQLNLSTDVTGMDFTVLPHKVSMPLFDYFKENNIPYAFVSDARLPEDAPGMITFAGREYHSHLIGIFCPIASDELVKLCETKL